MENRDRLFLNTIKGVAAFLMLWGHCIQYCTMGAYNHFNDAVYETIYSFHMPLFMFVSGYLFYYSFQKRDLKGLLIHRIQGMMQPIIFGTILYNLLMQLENWILSGNIALFDGSLFSGMNLLWFLWCVLSSSLAVGVACKITENGFLQGVLILLGVGFVALFPENDFHLYMYPFFVAGFFCAKYKTQLVNVFRKRKYIFLVLYPLMRPSFHWMHYVYSIPIYREQIPVNEMVKVELFRYLIGFAGIAFVLVVVDLIFQATVARGWIPKLVTALSKLGENSLQIYILSVPLLSGYLPVVYQKLMEPFGYNVFAQNWIVYSLIMTPLLSIVFAVGLYGVILLLKKLKIHALIFGR